MSYRDQLEAVKDDVVAFHRAGLSPSDIADIVGVPPRDVSIYIRSLEHVRDPDERQDPDFTVFAGARRHPVEVDPLLFHGLDPLDPSTRPDAMIDYVRGWLRTTNIQYVADHSGVGKSTLCKIRRGGAVGFDKIERLYKFSLHEPRRGDLGRPVVRDSWRVSIRQWMTGSDPRGCWSALARECGCSVQLLHECIIRYNRRTLPEHVVDTINDLMYSGPPPSRRMPASDDIDGDRVREMRDAGATLRGIAAELGGSYETIRTGLVKIRKKEGDAS